MQAPVEQLNALVHSKQAEAVGVLGGVEAAAVVAHAHPNVRLVLVNLHDGPLGAAVLGGVGERLLHDPVHRRLDLRRVALALTALLAGYVDAHVDIDALTLGAFAERLDRRGGPELVERGGAQVGDQRAQVRDPFLEMVDRAGDSLLERLGLARALGGREADAQR